VSAIPALAVHGGSGAIRREDMSPAREAACTQGLLDALAAGRRVLEAADGRALDAVIAAVRVLEDCEEFNAGRGAVLNSDGVAELDAAVMDGPTRSAGAVAAVTTVRNPVLLALEVMRSTPHVMLVGAGADRIAAELGLDIVDNEWFVTDTRRREHAENGGGTVGAVAVDASGAVAAATSTGGMTGQHAGRVGDTPIIGAGTWADDQVAISGTGHGELFIRAAVAHEIAARVRLTGESLAAAAEAALAGAGALGGFGGLIAVNAEGDLALPFNSDGMFRGSWAAGDEPVTAIYR
jgi:L-asparaginase / beta-aspartyl-peptidase